METGHDQNLTDSSQNLLPKNIQSLTGSPPYGDSVLQTSKNTPSGHSTQRTSGLGASVHNEHDEVFLTDSAPARPIDNEQTDMKYTQQKSKTTCFSPNFEYNEYDQTPILRRNVTGQGQSEGIILPDFQKLSQQSDKWKYGQTSTPGRIQPGQEIYDGMFSSGSQRFLSPHEEMKYFRAPTSRRNLLEQEQCEDWSTPGSQIYLPRQDPYRNTKLPGSWPYNDDGAGDGIQTKQEKVSFPVKRKEKKEKKSITTKTFAHGMMDVSLLTSNATQLRIVLSNPRYEFYTLLLWLIGLSIVLQLLSAIVLIASDFLKTQVKEIDRKNQGKRKFLNFLSLTLVTIVMSLNVLISAFSAPVTLPQQASLNEASDNIPAFSSPDIQTVRSEL